MREIAPKIIIRKDKLKMLENTVRKLAYGTLAGGLAALILFRARQLHPFFSKPCRAASPTSAAENDGCVACL